MRKELSDNHFSNNLNNLLKLSPILIIILGYIEQYHYFKTFGINIKFFLTINELPILFGSTIFQIGSLSIYILFFTVLVFEFLRSKINLKFWSIALKYFLLISCQIVTIYIGNLNYNPFLKSSLKHGFFLLIISTIFFDLYSNQTEELKKKFKNLNPRILYYIAISVSVVLIKASIEAEEVIVEKKYNGTFVKTEAGTKVSNDSIFFIGKTDKYLFFYNLKEETSEIIPMSEVKEFKIKSK